MAGAASYDLPQAAGPGRYRRFLTDLTKSAVGAVTGVFLAVMTPHVASLRRLADMPLMLASIGLFDYAGFQLPAAWGFVVTGISVLAIEKMISDPGESS